jgi:hypothetical protein
MKITNTTRTTVPPEQTALYVALARLARALAVLMAPPVFCSSCRAPVPDRKDLCIECENEKKFREMRARVYERISPGVKTIGGWATQEALEKFRQQGISQP